MLTSGQATAVVCVGGAVEGGAQRQRRQREENDGSNG